MLPWRRLGSAPSWRRLVHTASPATEVPTALKGPTEIATFVKRDVAKCRPRRDGFASLPLPPLMDPIRVAQRKARKNQDAKAEAVSAEELTPIQKELAANPFAQALSHPVRACRITEARLPSFFLTSFDLKSDPTDPKRIGLVPSKLYSAAVRDAPPSPSIDTAQVYLSSRKGFLDILSTQGRQVSKRVMNDRLGRRLAHMRYRGEVEWRRDMGDFIGGLLCQAVVGKLWWAMRNPKSGLLRRFEAIEANATVDKDHVACILVLDVSDTYQERRSLQQQVESSMIDLQKLNADIYRELNAMHGSRTAKARSKGIKDYKSHGAAGTAALQWDAAKAANPTTFDTWQMDGGKHVPVYHLGDLLEPVQLAELQESTSFEGARCLIVRRDRRTLPAQMALLQLQAYVN